MNIELFEQVVEEVAKSGPELDLKMLAKEVQDTKAVKSVIAQHLSYEALTGPIIPAFVLFHLAFEMGRQYQKKLGEIQQLEKLL